MASSRFGKFISTISIALVAWWILSSSPDGDPKGEVGDVRPRHCPVGRGHLPMLPDVGTIRRYSSPPDPDEFYRDHIRASVPAIIENAMDEWDALSLWQSDEYLSETVGSMHMLVERSNDDRFGHLLAKNRSWEFYNMTVSDFIQRYRSSEEEEPGGGDHWYMDYRLPPQLASDIALPAYIPCLESGVNRMDPYWAYINMWMGFGGENSLLHVDLEDNLLHMVQGYKRVTLVPPQTPARAVYEVADDASTETKLSPVDNYHPEVLEKWPAYADANPMHVTIRPGQVLFIPALWWHQVRSYCRQIAISIWFDFHGVKGMGEQFVWENPTSVVHQRLQSHQPLCTWREPQG